MSFMKYFSRDIENEEYRLFFILNGHAWSTISFFIRDDLAPLSQEGEHLLSLMDAFLLEKRLLTKEDNDPTGAPEEVNVTVFKYGVSRELLDVILKQSQSLFKWVLPWLPEDIQICSHDGRVWLRSITHEGFVELDLTQEEFLDISRIFPGLLVDHSEYLKNPPQSFYSKLYSEDND